MTRIVAVVTAAVLSLAGVAAGSVAERHELLPNLVPLRPHEVFGAKTGIVPSFGYGYPAPPIAVAGCLPDEIVRKDVTRCLRFDTVVVNEGAGHLELLFKAEPPQPGAYQVVYDRDGGARTRFATASEYHPTHHHFHLARFYEARLWRAVNRAARGAAPLVVGEKSGFCPEDGAREEGSGDARYRCLADYRTDGIGAGQVVGISAGWSDAYRMHLPDQFIDIARIDDGRYLLQITIDPGNQILESDERDNDACALIEIAGEDASIVKRGAACPPARPR